MSILQGIIKTHSIQLNEMVLKAISKKPQHHENVAIQSRQREKKSHEKAAETNQVHTYLQRLSHIQMHVGFAKFILFYCYYVTNSNMRRLLPASNSNEMKVNLNIIDCGKRAKEDEKKRFSSRTNHIVIQI